MTWIYVLAVLALLAGSALFSAAEMALSSANRIRLENLADDGKRAAAVAVKLLDRFDDALSAILIGNNFVNIALSALASWSRRVLRSKLRPTSQTGSPRAR